MPPNKDAALYGQPKAKKSSSKDISSSSSLAFSSQLSSLIASSKTKDATSRAAAGRARPGRKDDIFTAHNKNSKKRALKDLEDAQKHTTNHDQLDEAQWKRAKRKMEEKSRIYNAMKRGDIEDVDEKYGVDFDRKWVEAEERGENHAPDISSDEEEPESDEELVDYVDEFGRNMRGTRAAAAREEMRRRTQANARGDQFTARPLAPSNIIYGDTIQTEAFNPDEPIAAQMAEMAAKRDKTPTPPPDTHFDSRAEIRNRGRGFYAFSGDNEERARQMAALKKEREETERHRSEADKRKEQRRKEVEERRKAIQKKRAQGEADRFLSSLEDDLGRIGRGEPSKVED